MAAGGGAARRGLLKRKPNFTLQEIEILMSEVLKYEQLLFGAAASTVNAYEKQKIWWRITNKINAAGRNQRDIGEVKNRWRGLRRRAGDKISRHRQERQGPPGRAGGAAGPGPPEPGPPGPARPPRAASGERLGERRERHVATVRSALAAHPPVWHAGQEPSDVVGLLLRKDVWHIVNKMPKRKRPQRRREDACRYPLRTRARQEPNGNCHVDVELVIRSSDTPTSMLAPSCCKSKKIQRSILSFGRRLAKACSALCRALSELIFSAKEKALNNRSIVQVFLMILLLLLGVVFGWTLHSAMTPREGQIVGLDEKIRDLWNMLNMNKEVMVKLGETRSALEHVQRASRTKNKVPLKELGKEVVLDINVSGDVIEVHITAETSKPKGNLMSRISRFLSAARP